MSTIVISLIFVKDETKEAIDAPKVDIFAMGTAIDFSKGMLSFLTSTRRFSEFLFYSLLLTATLLELMGTISDIYPYLQMILLYSIIQFTFQ